MPDARRTLDQLKAVAAKHPYLVFSVCFIVSRSMTLVFNEGYAFHNSVEELIYSTISAERLRGNPLVNTMYYQEYTSGGFWLQTYLYMPMIWLLGCTREMVKTVAIAFSLAGSLSYLWVARRFFGDRVMAILATLILLGNPILLQHQVIAWANHNELAVFIAPMLGLTLYLLGRPRRSWGPAAAAFVLALLGNLAIFYCYTAMVPVLYVLLLSPVLLIVQWRRTQWRSLAILPAAAAGHFLGAWLATLGRAQVAHKVFGVYSATGTTFDIFEFNLRHGKSPVLPNITSFVTRIAIHLPGYLRPWTEWLFLVVFVAVSGAGLVAMARDFWRLRRAVGPERMERDRVVAGLVVGGLAATMFLAFAVRGWGYVWDPAFREHQEQYLLQFHQMVVLWPLLFFTMAVAAARVGDIPWRWRKVAGGAFWISIALLGVVSYAQVTKYPGAKMIHEYCSEYAVLIPANIQGIELNFPPEERCAEVEKFAASYDPAHADVICERIHAFSDCACPFESDAGTNKN